MGNVMDLDHVTEKATEQGQAQDLRFAASSMKGWRVSMEDCHTLCGSIPITAQRMVLADHSLFAVYDGHGGNLTSAFAGGTFVKYLSRRPEMTQYLALPKVGSKGRGDVTGIELLKHALKGTFDDLDRELRRIQNIRNVELQVDPTDPDTKQKTERSGSTICVVVVTPTHIICANAGDSRAILKRGRRILPLSFDHKPSNLPESERIFAAGGYVKMKRVDGDLAVSRGLGDFSFKSQPDLATKKQKVICSPDFIVYPRDEKNDEFMVLACDGVWDVASNEQCGSMVQTILNEGENNIGSVCEEVLDMCLEKNSRDNMTIVTVFFPAVKMSRERVASNAVAKRRTARRQRILEIQAKQAAQNAAKKVGIEIGLEDETKLSERKKQRHAVVQAN
jgi:serine/threonine protein phosphatase PrpC